MKKLLIVALLLNACGPGCVVYPQERPKWLEAKILKGAGFLSKRLILARGDIGGISDISLRREDGIHTVVVAGTKGALFLEPGTFEVKRRIQYNEGGRPFNAYTIVDTDGDGVVEFFRITHPGGEATLYSTEGKPIWTHKNWKLNRAAIGDLDGDGKMEYVLSGHISRTIYVLDHQGRPRWSKIAAERGHGPTDVLILDTNGGDDKEDDKEIVYVDGERLNILDENGNFVCRERPAQGGYVNALYVVRYRLETESADKKRLCVGYSRRGGQVYTVFELDGRTFVAELRSEDLGKYLPGRPVRLDPTRESFRTTITELLYQGTLVGFSATRLRLTVFDAGKEPVYDEVIACMNAEVPKGDGALAVAPISGKKKEAILVGYGPELWEYRRAESKRERFSPSHDPKTRKNDGG